jgi:hypothetical protein
VKVKFLDLDFFVEEAKKTAERNTQMSNNFIDSTIVKSHEKSLKILWYLSATIN